MPFRQSLAQAAKLDVDDLLQVLLAQGVEDDDLVHAVEEFGPEMPLHLLDHRLLHALVSRSVEGAAVFQDARAADVRGHDHDRVLEIDRAPLAVGQPAVVQ